MQFPARAAARLRRSVAVSAATVVSLSTLAVGAAAGAPWPGMPHPSDDRAPSPAIDRVALAGIDVHGDTTVTVAGRAPQARLAPRDAERAAELLRAMGIEPGGAVDAGDIRRAAKRLGADLGRAIDPSDVDRLLELHRAQAAPVLRAIGVRPGSTVDLSDIARGAEILGLDTGARVDPTDVVRVTKAAAAKAGRRAPSFTRAATNTDGGIFAKVDGVKLAVPSDHVKMIGFHQASYRVARGMKPTGLSNMRTLPSRGRGTNRRSAADIAVTANTPVFAPVTGRVVEVKRYNLYGRYADTRIRIVPDGRGDRLVTVLHVTGATVERGDWITAGSTKIARKATQFPFESQIDRFAGRGPHVHVEVRSR